LTVWTPTALSGSDLVDLVIIQWGPNVTTGDTFIGLGRGDFADRSIQCEGVFGGATVQLFGSNDATTGSNGNYRQLHDPFNNLISISSPGIVQILEVTAWMKPVLVNATGTTSITITTCQRLSR